MITGENEKNFCFFISFCFFTVASICFSERIDSDDMRRWLKNTLKISSSVLVCILIILVILLVGVRLFGLRVYAVMSGSMEPSYPTGALIYVREIDPLTLRENDVITYRVNESLTVTHRIVDIVFDSENSDSVCFRTKGDANNVADGILVKPDNIIGIPVFTIPYLGYLAQFIQNPPGRYIALAVSVIIILYVIISDYLIGGQITRKNKNNI